MPGVAEAVVIAEEKLAYLKVDSKSFDAAMAQLAGAGERWSVLSGESGRTAPRYDINLISQAERWSAMVDILVRNLDKTIARRLKEKAKAKGASVNETARQAIAAFVMPNKEDAWAAVDRIRAKIGKVSGDSTADIRADRDSR